MPDSENVKRKSIHTIDGLAIQLLVIAGLCIISGYLGKFYWAADLLSHFALQYIIGLIPLILILLFRKNWKWLLIGLLLLFSQLYEISPLVVPTKRVIRVSSDQERISLLTYNILGSNRHKKELMDWLIKEAEEVDILVLQEVTHPWLPELEKLKKIYPVYKIDAHNNLFGTAIYSKLPNTKISIKNVELDMATVIMTAETKKKNLPISLFSSHPPPPMNNKHWQMRNRVLLNQFIAKDSPANVIVTGDFNITPYSYWYKKFAKETGLHNSSEGMGLFHSWPSMDPWLLRIPIDHTLISNGLIVVEKVIYDDSYGSDHYPIKTVMVVDE